MKIYLDRSVCKCWDGACEQDFSDKYLGGEIKPTACTLAVVEDDKDKLTFMIHDRDGKEKVFVVDDNNLYEAIDSWILAYQKQKKAMAEEASG